MFDYEGFLIEKLNIIKDEMSLSLNIEISTEQAYLKMKSYSPNTIYVILKYLSSDITFGAKTQPVQILFMSEQNQLSDSRMLLTTFTERYNFFAEIKTFEIDGKRQSDFIKHQYSTPVVLSNFNEVGIGYRSTLYVSASLVIMENIIDLNDLKIDGEEIKSLSASISYTMTPDTQQVGGEFIASSVKSNAVMTIGLTIPLLNNNLTEKIINIMQGNGTGNEDFIISYKLGDLTFNNVNYKLTSSVIGTAPNSVPAFVLGFQK